MRGYEGKLLIPADTLLLASLQKGEPPHIFLQRGKKDDIRNWKSETRVFGFLECCVAQPKLLSDLIRREAAFCKAASSLIT
jgi:hypothetical protein